MRRCCLLFLGMCLAALPGTSARADTFYFAFAGSVYSGSGEFIAIPTTGPPNVDTYLVIAVNGTAAFDSMTTSITGIAPLGAGAQDNDNLLFYPGVNGSDFFDGGGVGFYLASGVIVDLFAYSGIYETIPGQGILEDSGPITVAPTPEPSSLILFATPMLALLGSRMWRWANNTIPSPHDA